VKTKLLLLFFLGLAQVLAAQPIYYLSYDRDKSAKMGAEDILTFNRAFAEWQDSYMLPQINDNKGLWNKSLAVTYRLGKTVIIDNVWNDLIRLIQHEVFGHGARLRELGYTKNKYSITFPSPWFGGGGTATYGRREEGRVHGLTESITPRFGGVEATSVMANSIRSKWLASGKIYYREAYTYYRSFNGLTRYIMNTRNDETEMINDMFSYTKTLSFAYGIPLEESPIRIEDLKRKVIINYFNPLQYLALYALIKGYIWDGNTEMELPMIPIGSVDYFPIVRMGLTPFGTEVYVENFFKLDKTLHLLQVRIGDGVLDNSWGLTYHNNRLLDKPWIWLQGDFNFWNQPSMKLGGDEFVDTRAGLGGAVQLGAHFKILRKENLANIYLQTGYKTAGFLEGERLRAGWLVRFGLSFVQQ
jgi:hypothetical protein